MFLVNPVTSHGPVHGRSAPTADLDAPACFDPNLGQKLTIQPGERYEVIIDLTDMQDRT
jgi:hypothetical protein